MVSNNSLAHGDEFDFPENIRQKELNVEKEKKTEVVSLSRLLFDINSYRLWFYAPPVEHNEY